MPFQNRFIFAALLVVCHGLQVDAQLLKVGVAELSHDHAHGILSQFKKNQVIILGIAERDPQLIARYKDQYRLPDSLFYVDLKSMLSHVHPDAVLAYNPISEHKSVVEICAPMRIPVMVEKPLATTFADAEIMQALAIQYNIPLLTNYETTWYATNQKIKTMVDGQSMPGKIRKMIVHDGHQGPKEIGSSKEFLAWLTDPVKNGGGALMDFGCYGANLMTWFMNGRQPIAVTAVTHHIKPGIYPNVDDDATILLEYADATGLIEASWNWPFSIKDTEVFGDKGYLHALDDRVLQQRDKKEYARIDAPAPAYTDNLVYLADILRGKVKSENDLSSLNNNMIVVKILEAARISANEGRRVALK